MADDAPNEVTDEVAELHETAHRFKQQGYKEFQDWCVISGDTTATGMHAYPSTKTPSFSEEEDATFGDEEGNSFDRQEDEVASFTLRKIKSSMKKKKAKKKRATMLKDMVMTITENSRKKLELYEKKMSTDNIGRNKSRQQEFSEIMECVQVLHGLGVAGLQYGQAVKAFHDSPVYRDIFMNIPDERKLDWVNSL